MDNSSNIMKKFSQSVNDYVLHNADSSAVEIQKHLQSLASTTDAEIFNPSLEASRHFFISLHQLMSGLDSTSMLVSASLDVLQTACANSDAVNMLRSTCKFIPVLTRFLSTNHVSDKQMRLLRVLADLTYSVKITWQEAHIPKLVSHLVQIIMGNNRDHKMEALSVLVNLCYKNMPVIYVLMRQVEIKKFLKSVLVMNDNPTTRMQVCKLLFSISEIKGPLPDEELLHFLDGSFNSIAVAFRNQDSKTLRQVTDFFRDILEKDQIQGVIPRFAKAYGGTAQLLELIENSETHDEHCLAILLEFLPTAFTIKAMKTSKLIPKCVRLAAAWLGNKNTDAAAMKVMLMAAELIAYEEGITEALSKVLETLCARLTPQQVMDATENNTLIEMTGIVTVIAAMASCSALRKQVITSVDTAVIKTLCTHLYQPRVTRCSQEDELTVCLLLLVATLSTFAENWMALYLELLSLKPVFNSLSVVLLTGDKDMKYKVLRLVGSAGWGKDTLTSLCEILIDHTTKVMDGVNHLPAVPTVTDSLPLMPLESRIDEVLQRLSGEIGTGEGCTSAIMELFEYKISSMRYAEQQTLVALAASDERCTALNQQVAQQRWETEKLHKILLYQQQTLDGSCAERKDFLLQIDRLSNQNSEEKTNFHKKTREYGLRIQELEAQLAEQNSQLAAKNEKIREFDEQRKQTQSELLARNAECGELKGRLTNLNAAYEDAIKANKASEERLRTSETHNAEYKAQLSDLQAEHNEVKSSLLQCMEKLSQKEELLTEYNKKVHYLEQIREAVISVAGRKDTF